MAETKGVVKIDDPKQLEINNWKETIEKWRRISLKAIPYGFFLFFIALFFPFRYAILMIFLSIFPIASWYASHSFKEVKKWEKMLIFRRGDLYGEPRDPGWHFTLWPQDRTVFVKTYERRIDIPPQQIILDNPIEGRPTGKITAMVDSILWFKIIDAEKAVIAVEDVYGAVKDYFLVTLRGECSKHSLWVLIGQKEEGASKEDINKDILTAVKEKVANWGVEITKAGIQDVQPPKEIVEAMNAVMAAERGREATIIKADAEAKRVETVYRKIYKEDPELLMRTLEAMEKFAEGKGSPIIFGGIKQFLRELLGKEEKK